MSEEYIITQADFSEIKPKTTLPDSINNKLMGFWNEYAFPHNLRSTDYDEVYVTSDIHADVYKLNALLSNAGLIDNNGSETRDTLLRETQWLKKRTLLIIVGDLVDGARNGHSEIPDPIGDIELLLHVYLFNLRNRALLNGGDVRFTIGNHDYHTVIKETSTELPHFYKAWVHRSAMTYFGSREMRRSCLLPFYNCCPYIILRFSLELAFVHGGFHSQESQGIDDMTDSIINIQNKLDLSNDFRGLTDEDHALLNNLGRDANEKGSALWTRFYSYGKPAEVCSNVGTTFQMVIVGHCQTDSCATGETMKSILSGPKFSECTNGGCALLGCDKEQGAPSLAFVDISMSAAFRNKLFYGMPLLPDDRLRIVENSRRAELLKFTHDATLDISQRYYNKITREKVGGRGPIQTLLYWQAPAKAGGRTRKNRRKNRKSRRSRSQKF